MIFMFEALEVIDINVEFKEVVSHSRTLNRCDELMADIYLSAILEDKQKVIV